MLPPAIDISSGADDCRARFEDAELRREFDAFVLQIELYYGRHPIFYSNGRSVLGDGLSESEKNLWVRALFIHPRAFAGNNWMFWQYRINGLTLGISGNVDLNVFNGREQEFFRFVNQ